MEDTNTAKEILHRMKYATNTASDSDLGRILSVSQQAIYNARASGKIPKAWPQRIVAEGFNASVDWLLYGDDITAHPRQRWGRAGRIPKEPEIVMVPMVEARLSAGTGSFETSDDIDSMYAFRADFLGRKGNVADMVIMRVAGDSMEPHFKDGDSVLIDQGKKEPRAGEVYAIGVEDLVYLKIVNTLPGKLVLSSYNKEYEQLEVDTREQLADSVRIIGRVIWSCHEW